MAAIDITTIIVAALAAIPATVAAYASMENSRNIKRSREENQQTSADAAQGREDAYQVGEDNRIATEIVHQEVKTGNGLTNGQIADALYTHQIEKTKTKDRTDIEDHHMESIGETQAPDEKKRSEESGK